MITLFSSLSHSLIILEFLRNDERLKKISVTVGTFTNCRECGLTYISDNGKGKYFTWCTYEHRNGDQLIINGRDGYITLNSELPYKWDKWTFLESFSYNEHYECAKKLIELIMEFAGANPE